MLNLRSVVQYAVKSAEFSTSLRAAMVLSMNCVLDHDKTRTEDQYVSA